jgi:hypothetical protein
MTNELLQLPLVAIGEVAGVDGTGRPVVRVRDAEAIATVVWMPHPPEWHDCIGGRVAIGFIDGDERQPLVLGLLDPPRAGASSDRPDVLRLESGRSLVIECGEARISLREDGRVEIRGTHVISRSSGPNKVKGGSVHIN